MTHVWGKQVPFYASLAYGVDLHMRELDGTRSSASQDVLHISKRLNQTENAFSSTAAGSLRGLVYVLHSHVR